MRCQGLSGKSISGIVIKGEKLQRALKALDEAMVKSLDGVFEHLEFEPESPEDRVYMEDVDINV